MASFNFTWNNDNKKTATAVVFARKKKKLISSGKPSDQVDKSMVSKRNVINKGNTREGLSVKKTGMADNITIKEIVTKVPPSKEKIDRTARTMNKLMKTDKARAFTPKFQEKSVDNQNKLIKRKQKKDKLAAKQTTNEKNSTVLNTNKSTQSQSHSLFAVGHKDLHINTNIKGKSVVENVFSKGKTFSNLNIHKYLVSNLEKVNFKTLTNVQEKSIPVVLSGKNVLIRSQTGSGKTLAYALPIMDALQGISPRIQRNDGVQAIIVVPTRELALQTHELFGKINTFQWIVVGYLCGGENRNTEKTRLRKGVHVLIATPGRLLDHMMHTTSFKTNNVRCLVLDEADRLLDMGFKKDIVKIVEGLDQSKSNSSYDPIALLKGDKVNLEDAEDVEQEDGIPLRNPKSKKRQTLLLSATLNKDIAELADFTMKEHVYIDALDESATINPEHMVIPNTVKQKFIVTHVKHRLFTLSAMLASKAKSASKVFVFMATSQMVEYHYELFTRYLVKMPINRGKLRTGGVVLLNDMDDSDDEEEVVLNVEIFKLHGSMDQSARKAVFTKFRSAKAGVLLCTDVAARGIDVPTADCIIQYTGPQSDQDYLHRVGRTGRAGKSGESFIFLTHEEQDFVTRLQQHKVFLQEHDPAEFLKLLSVLMEEPDHEMAASALQRHYENALSNDKELHKMACLAYTSWSRFYNTFPSKMRSVFDFKNVNLGHYVTSFGLKETPTDVARIVRGQVTKTEPRKLNMKLAIHDEEQQTQRPKRKRKIKSVSLTTSEFSSGLESSKKKKKRKNI